MGLLPWQKQHWCDSYMGFVHLPQISDTILEHVLPHLHLMFIEHIGLFALHIFLSVLQHIVCISCRNLYYFEMIASSYFNVSANWKNKTKQNQKTNTTTTLSYVFWKILNPALFAEYFSTRLLNLIKQCE